MNLRYRLLTFILLLGFLGFETTTSFAQVGDVGSILQAGKEDANTLAQSYLEPFGSGFGAALNTGWTNTAAPHSTLGFDLTVSTGLAIVPNSAKSFDVNELGLQKLELEGSDPISPTINGDNQTGALLAAYEDPDGPGGIDEQKIIEFNMPEGTGFGYVPAPMIKGAVGVFKDTEIMLRYTPEIDVGDFGSFNLFGVGAKHGINQWLPGGNVLPVDLSVMFGYTGMEVGAGLDITADDVIQDPDNTENPYNASHWEGQEISLNTDAWTINALVGKSLPVVSVYAGVGYEASTLNISTPGSYPTVVPNNPDFQNDPNNNEPFIVDDVEEPIDLSIDGDNGLRAMAGFRFRFTVFHVSGSYTLSNYSSYNLGVGISFR
jgi:hypothetical protein